MKSSSCAKLVVAAAGLGPMVFSSSSTPTLTDVAAFSSYKARVPNGDAFGSKTSHLFSGGGPRNPFGTDFKAVGGKQWTT